MAKGPENIKLVDIDLNLNGPGHLRDLIYGPTRSESYDGIHLNGRGARRHFNYRAKQSISPIITQLSQSLCQQGKKVQSRTQFSFADASKHQRSEHMFLD